MTTHEFRLYESLREAYTFLGQLAERCPAESEAIDEFRREHMVSELYGFPDLVRAIFLERQRRAEAEVEERRVMAAMLGDDDPRPAA